ncbi:MAG: phosphate uptake regulator PhoU [Candidatus Methanoperedens sp.]|nr:phosphate uptake regulator PhoU [Candidatus Methanoperedens sp.]
METRKVYVSGGSTYVISLPKKWVKKANLKAGDSLVVTEHDGSLLIETSIAEKKSQVKEIKISQLTSSDALERMIIAFYLVGYDTIKIKLDRKDHLPYRESIRRVLDYLIGIEILEDTNDAMTLEIMVDYKRMSTMQILQRMYAINRSMLFDLSKALKNNDIGLAKDIIIREGEIDRLYFLVVRQLKSAVEYQQVAEKLGIENQRDCLGYRIVVKILERIADHIENISQRYLELLDTEHDVQMGDFIKLNNDVSVIFEKSFNALFTKNYALADTIFHERDELKKVLSGFSDYLLLTGNVPSALMQKGMFDSLGRIASYSADLAEIAINMTAGD